MTTDISRDKCQRLANGDCTVEREYSATLLALRAALDRAEADKAAAVEAEREVVMNAAGEYMRDQYGIANLFHPTDRARIAAIRAGAKP